MIKKITYSVFLILALLLTIQITNPKLFANKNTKVAIHSKVNARTIWYEQTFGEKVWGNGIFQIRRKFTADARKPDNERAYENRKILNSWSNRIDMPIIGTYQEERRYGHNISGRAKGKASYFEVEVGYSFNYENVTTTTTSITINPNKNVTVYQSDIRVKYHFVDVKVVKQKGSFSGFNDTTDWWWEDEIIRQYSGNHIEVVFT